MDGTIYMGAYASGWQGRTDYDYDFAYGYGLEKQSPTDTNVDPR